MTIRHVRTGTMLPVDDPAPCDECARLTGENMRLRAFVAAFDAWKEAFDAWPNDRHAALWARVQQARATITAAPDDGEGGTP